MHETRHFAAERLNDFYLVRRIQTNGVVGQIVNGEFKKKMFAILSQDDLLEIMTLTRKLTG